MSQSSLMVEDCDTELSGGTAFELSFKVTPPVPRSCAREESKQDLLRETIQACPSLIANALAVSEGTCFHCKRAFACP